MQSKKPAASLWLSLGTMATAPREARAWVSICAHPTSARIVRQPCACVLVSDDLTHCCKKLFVVCGPRNVALASAAGVVEGARGVECTPRTRRRAQYHVRCSCAMAHCQWGTTGPCVLKQDDPDYHSNDFLDSHQVALSFIGMRTCNGASDRSQDAHIHRAHRITRRPILNRTAYCR